MVFALACGLLAAALCVAGAQLIVTGRFPDWLDRRLLWPLRRIDGRVARLQGGSSAAVGLALPLAVLWPALGAGYLLLSLASLLTGTGLFLYSAWLSWQP